MEWWEDLDIAGEGISIDYIKHDMALKLTWKLQEEQP